jgi:hypothetical protein
MGFMARIEKDAGLAVEEHGVGEDLPEVLLVGLVVLDGSLPLGIYDQSLAGRGGEEEIGLEHSGSAVFRCPECPGALVQHLPVWKVAHQLLADPLLP